jgi:hypothetical protein
MDFEVLGEMLDALAEERNLHFWRTGVRRMNSELLNLLLFLRFSNPHNLRFFLSLSFLVVIFLTYWSRLVKQRNAGAAPFSRITDAVNENAVIRVPRLAQRC